MVMVEENVKKENKSGEDNESTVIRFSCAQTHIVEKVENPEVIWDSGSTMVLAKKKSMLESITKWKVMMCYNGGNRSIEGEGHWPGVRKSYLEEMTLTNIMLQSKVIKEATRLNLILRKRIVL